MANVIVLDDLSSYLRDAYTGGGQILVDLTNDLIADVAGDLPAWPASVRAVALEVAARGYRSTPGVSSTTVSTDGTSKTVRREGSAVEKRAGVYLTAGEKAEILAAVLGRPAAARAGTIMTHVPVTWPT